MPETEVEFERLQRITQGIYKFCEATRTTKTGGEEQLGKVCLQIAQDLTGSKFGFIGEITPEGKFSDIALSDPGWENCRMPKTQAVLLVKDMEIRGIWGAVIKSGSPLICNDPAKHPDRVGTPPGHPPLLRFLGVPLQDQGRTFGMIALANKESDYDTQDLNAIMVLAQHLSLIFRLR